MGDGEIVGQALADRDNEGVLPAAGGPTVLAGVDTGGRRGRVVGLVYGDHDSAAVSDGMFPDGAEFVI